MSVQEEGKSRAESPEARRDWCVYLLTCADGTLYCGVTSDLARRLALQPFSTVFSLLTLSTS